MLDNAEAQVRRVLDELAKQGVKPQRLCADSRQVLAGDIFLAFPGLRADGRRFIESAVHAGAAAVLWERDGHVWDARLPVPHVAVDGLAALSGYLAHEVYGRPSEGLWTVGVTGTNGKTSVTQWLSRAYAALGRKCGVIGTLGIGFPGALTESLNTTPDSLTLHRTLAEFRAAKADVAAMEVSSIGLDQERLALGAVHERDVEVDQLDGLDRRGRDDGVAVVEIEVLRRGELEPDGEAGLAVEELGDLGVEQRRRARAHLVARPDDRVAEPQPPNYGEPQHAAPTPLRTRSCASRSAAAP